MIDASGSLATVSQAFAVTIANYRFNGRTVYAPSNEPSVPSDLDGLILHIGGLNNIELSRPANSVQLLRFQMPATGPGGGYTPDELRAGYDMNSLLSAANGSGQTTAIFELDGYNPSDIGTYQVHYGLPQHNYSNVLVDGATGAPGPGSIEVELDMEVVSATAPNASQKVTIQCRRTATDPSGGCESVSPDGVHS